MLLRKDLHDERIRLGRASRACACTLARGSRGGGRSARPVSLSSLVTVTITLRNPRLRSQVRASASKLPSKPTSSPSSASRSVHLLSEPERTQTPRNALTCATRRCTMSTPDLHSLADSFTANTHFDGSLASTLTLPGSDTGRALMPTVSSSFNAAAQDALEFKAHASTSPSREPSPAPTAGPSSLHSVSPRTLPSTIKPQDLLSSTTLRLDDDSSMPALDIPLPPEPADLFMARKQARYSRNARSDRSSVPS